MRPGWEGVEFTRSAETELDLESHAVAFSKRAAKRLGEHETQSA
jgi:hypothetical protein